MIDFAYIKIKTFQRALLFHLLAGHGLCLPCLLHNCELLVILRVFRVFSVNHYYLTFELVLV
jgi:hypothetical protein